MTGLDQLLERWSRDADLLDRHGAHEAAESKRTAAQELEEWATSYWSEPLNVKDAAAFGGYSERQLYELLRQGEIPNAGGGGAKLILRRHVPIRRVASGDAVPYVSGAVLGRSRG